MNNENNDEDLPLITVITPTYNSRYLKDTIESLLKQTYPKIEYIITDDGSDFFPNDEINMQIKEGNKDNITYKLLLHKNNMGTVKNINSAIKASNGEYIFYLSHDDILYDENVLLERVRYFQRTNALASTALVELVSFDLKEKYGIFPIPKEVQDINYLPPEILLNKSWLCHSMLGCTAGFSKKCFEKYGLHDERYQLLEDAPMFYNLLNQGVRIYIWDNIAIKYRHSKEKRNNYLVNTVYLKDRIQLIKDKICYYCGIKKIILQLELVGVQFILLAIQHNPKYGIIFSKIIELNLLPNVMKFVEMNK